ncbi:YihY/virulence factor BrkB family protein [Sphaerimonospora thailandensis]|uniref:Ribonuclease n=1 Tax=Sphaerimonospora thailandensis TaxID=795644 RepID=A0A8J3VZS4_9ACTN|nr:YihY/virulence factor BrkB family protein [Sphaerimonospora thailandensis]GIH70415.1 ribonuclease [Sphaerimonospora thailandensis]
MEAESGVIDRVKRRVAAAKEWGREFVERERFRHRWVDHLIRTVQRYHVREGDRLAGALTYFAFLSFFPLLALAFALFGVIVTFRPDALATLIKAVNAQLPGLAEQLHIDQLAGARAGAGVIGLLGLFYAGLGAIEALRTALRDIWMTSRPKPSFFVGKFHDLVALALLGVIMLVSVVVSGFAAGATGAVAGWLGLGGSVFGEFTVRLAGAGASLLADLLIFLVILGWLIKPDEPLRVVLKGALLGAVGFGLLKQLAALILSGTLRNPIYGTFAVIVGLLLWINLSARLVLYTAAWTATATLGPPPGPTPLPSPAIPDREEPWPDA